MDLQQIYSKIKENRTEMVSSLSKLVSIPSVAVETAGDKPFGDAVHEAFTTMLDMGRAEGFRVFNADNYGGHIDFPGQEDGIIGVVGHLDVVPEGDGWDFEPYGGEILERDEFCKGSEGPLVCICGRGSQDDKGPVIASFYAMKALKECGFRPAKTIRLILGLDEETNWQGMRYYLSMAGDVPECGFTPDADFPLVRAEKGILVFDIAGKFGKTGGKGLELTSIKGGTAPNAVAGFARAVIMDSSGGSYDFIKEMVANARAQKGWKINCKGIGKSFEITVQGKPAHGARPEKGINAISQLMEFLGGLNFINEDAADFVSFFNEHIGYDLHGERIGCCISDEDSGQLVFNVGMIEMDKNAVRLTINIRYPVSAVADDIYAGIMEVVDPYGMGIVKGKHQLPINIPEDSPLITELMDVYQTHTGDMQSKPRVEGGGTYARAFDNFVAFGARFPGEPGLEHHRNEHLPLDNLEKLACIYADAISRLAGEAAPEETE